MTGNRALVAGDGAGTATPDNVYNGKELCPK